MDPEAVVKSFIEKQRRDKTKVTYERELNIFKVFIGDVSLIEINTDHAKKYYEYLMAKMHSKEYEKSTVIKILRILMSFYKYVIDNKEELQIATAMKTNPFYNVNIPKQDIGIVPQERILNSNELNKFLIVAEKSARNNAIIHLLINSRFVPTEITAINWGDFFRDAEGRLGADVLSRGGKRRIIPINEDVFENILGRYRQERNLPDVIDKEKEKNSPVFINRDGDRLSETMVRKIVYAICENAGVKQVSPKDLTHLCALLGIYNDGTNEQLLNQTGVSSLNVLSKYKYSVQHLKDPLCDKINLSFKEAKVHK